MISAAKSQLVFFLLLTAGISALVFFIFKPFLGPIFLAIIIAIASYPIYRKLNVIFGGKKAFASFLTVLMILVVFLLPAIFTGLALFKEAAIFYNNITSEPTAHNGFLANIKGLLENKISIFSPEFSINLETYLKNIAGWVFGHLDNFFSSFIKIVINSILMTVSLFYFLKDGERIVKRLVAWSPLADSFDEQIGRKIGLAINSLVRGSLIIALIKGLLTALGFAIFGVSNPILWGLVSALASFVPMVGSSIVIIPAALYLFVTSSYGSAIGLATWGVVLVGLSDNILSPALMKNGMKIHPFLILLSIFGGLKFFGPVGFIAGPVTLSLLFALYSIYPIIIKSKLEN